MRFWILLFIPIILIFLHMLPAQARPVDRSKAVIHHTASHDAPASEIDKWHKERGWDGIGYHFVIRRNGTIEKGRPLTKLGAHAKGRNHYIGIALTGYDEFTQAQKDALIWLMKDLGIRHIEPHHEQCPGEGLKGIYKRKVVKND